MEIDHTKPDNFGLIAQRLRARLDLANFKCQYGYQNMDLRSLESLIVQCTKSNHTTTNTIDSAAMKNHIRRIINTTSNYKHRYYPVAQAWSHHAVPRVPW
ncbi:hypothetical protein DM01DRAFT_1338020 [Hesseltinella vesiculosa]|uniref:Uncharacterized protein n=1 Tax=Hesseltinella vesiculosa TaxID=101127 RepID=A0A1X2GBI8_9FUNG|nr:hypothetical protein DM01DRAFT_1338020 [Hesseltinella vesiculosa]